MTRNIRQGSPYPFGCSWNQGYWNFALYSENEIEALFVAPHFQQSEHERILLNPQVHKSGSIWHIAIEAKEPAICWGWKVKNQNPLFIDPYAPLLNTGSKYCDNNWAYFDKQKLLSTYSPSSNFNWENSENPKIAPNDLIIYEMHLKAFTQHASSHVQFPGTYLGVIEKIPYLLDLGINAIELLPIYEFNEMEWNRENPRTHERLSNFWGYSPLSFFSPMMRYGTTDDPFETAKELKLMVKKLHEAGIAVILDVVYNHTGEGNENGPTYCYKAFAPNTYYLKNDGHYLNYSGCGNSLNASHSIVSDLILASLRHFVLEYKIDGFRFDLASEMTRNMNGAPSQQPPLFERLLQDPILKEKYLMVEPWDAAGLHQAGQLYQLNQWGTSTLAEWNDDYRDTMRKFIRGDANLSGRFAGRFCGSQDIFSPKGSPRNSLNFITCHDGFTLHDLVSYNQKHNFDNGEQNRDGTDNNLSWNCGHEGASSDSQIARLREKQVKNFFASLFLSQGIPMILSGDECGHTKHGNNNTWCQNNDLNWFIWSHVKTHSSLVHFVKELIQLRKRNPVLSQPKFLAHTDIEWHGRTLFTPDWTPDSRLISCTFLNKNGERLIHAIWNSSDNPEQVEIPPINNGAVWKLVISTKELPPRDITHPNEAASITSQHITISSKSVIVLEASKTFTH